METCCGSCMLQAVPKGIAMWGFLSALTPALGKGATEVPPLSLGLCCPSQLTQVILDGQVVVLCPSMALALSAQ
jgi:hypothetical protein